MSNSRHRQCTIQTRARTIYLQIKNISKACSLLWGKVNVVERERQEGKDLANYQRLPLIGFKSFISVILFWFVAVKHLVAMAA